MSEQQQHEHPLKAFSDGLADAVARAGASIVRVEGRQRQAASGFVWDEHGRIVTASHVVEKDEQIVIGLPNGGTTTASLVGRDDGTDVALLRLEQPGGVPAERAAHHKIGSMTFLVARPGDGLATSFGVISAIESSLRDGGQHAGESVLLTDATFYPGFSGGAMIDLTGSVIGLATSGSRGERGVVVPVQTVDRIVTILQSQGRVSRGFLGITSQPVPLPPALREAAALQQERGLLVLGTEIDGPAAQGGMLVGDIVVMVAEKPVRSPEELFVLLRHMSGGLRTPIGLIRGGKRLDLDVTLGNRA